MTYICHILVFITVNEWAFWLLDRQPLYLWLRRRSLAIFNKARGRVGSISRKFIKINFWDFKWQILLSGHKYCQFFVIFDEDDVLFILVQFESDRISPRESAKNGRMGAHGLNCIIWVNSELGLKIYVENYPRKKIQVSTTLLKFSWWNLPGDPGPSILV